MAMLETDLEQLEQYLDGALDTAEVSELESRLKTDSELSDMLTELKSQRAVRSAVWQSMEPDTVSAERLVWRLRGAMLEQDRTVALQPKKQWNPWRIASISSTAAACVMLGFMFGRGGHTPVATPGAMPSPIASNTPTGGQLIKYTNTAPVTASNTPQKYSVPITNEYGQVVAWQTFDNKDQAKNFTEDLRKTSAQPAAPAAAGQTRLVDQEQF